MGDFLGLLFETEEFANQANNLLIDARDASAASAYFINELSVALQREPDLQDVDDVARFLVNFCADFHDRQPPERFCQGASPKSKNGSKSRIMRLLDMQHYEFGPFQGRGWAEKDLREIRQKISDNPDELSGTLTGLLRGSCQHFFWVTETECVEKMLATRPEETRLPGQVIRDTMGFMNDIGDVEYIELQISDDFFGSLEPMRPTIVEGGFNLVYCSWPHATYSTGFTWDIFRSTLGVPEFVSPARHLRPGKTRLRYLARVVFDTPPYPDWSALSVRAQEETEDLRKTLTNKGMNNA